jgi:ubiquinone/menaquinone biosynthesis C-methylase UbiE
LGSIASCGKQRTLESDGAVEEQDEAIYNALTMMYAGQEDSPLATSRPMRNDHLPAVEQLRRANRKWTRISAGYDIGVRMLFGPFWRRWQDSVLPFAQGRVLEVGCGTGALLQRLAGRRDAVGVDVSVGMLNKAAARLGRNGAGRLVRADAQRLPFKDGSFDAALSTFALTAVPDLHAALAEMVRVTRDGGKVVVVSVGNPASASRLTRMATAVWRAAGDTIRDEAAALRALELRPSAMEFGPFGSVHLVVAVKSSKASHSQNS